MKIPEELINNFLTSEFKVKTTSTDELRINSFYVPDQKYHIYINKKTGQFTDFKSGESGSFVKLLRDYLDVPTTSEAINYLVTNYNLGDSSSSMEEPLKIINTPEIIENFLKNDNPKFFNDTTNLGFFGRRAYNYVLSRKLDNYYYPKLGYVFNDNSRYNERIIIPFFENGDMVYFISRAVDPKNPLRYLNVDKLDSKEYVFNIDHINEEVIIAEGTFDAMSITIDQPATALLSADIGTKQLEKLFEKKVKTIIYVADQDKTGLAKMDNNIRKLITYAPYTLDVRTFTVPKGCKDLNDMKVKTGKNYILKKETEKYGSNLWSKSLW